MKGKDLHIFIRFGGLDLKKQKGFKSDGSGTFHSPPANRGFYAMPRVAQEFFLISSMSVYQPGTTPNPPDVPDGTPQDEANDIWDNHEKSYKRAVSVKRKEFYKKDGNIWHHLQEDVDNHEVVSRHGSWVKTSISAWEKAFSKMSLRHRYHEGDAWTAVNSINETKGILGWYSKDHCEVFFDEKV